MTRANGWTRRVRTSHIRKGSKGKYRGSLVIDYKHAGRTYDRGYWLRFNFTDRVAEPDDWRIN